METEDKYPSFDFNFKKIWEHIKTLPDYESAVEYLDHVEAQFEHTHLIFIMHIFSEMGLRKYLSLTDGFRDCDEPLPDGTKRGEEVLEIAARFAMSELGFYNIKHLYNEKEIVEIIKDKIVIKKWIVYDEETKAWHFLLSAVAGSIRSEFKSVRSAVDQLMHRGRLLRRKESSHVPVSEENTEIELTESDPAFRNWQDFGFRLGLHLDAKETIKVFNFMKVRKFIESFTFNDDRLNWISTIPILKGFLKFLHKEKCLERGYIGKALVCFDYKGDPLVSKQNWFEKSNVEEFPFGGELKNLLPANTTKKPALKRTISFN